MSIASVICNSGEYDCGMPTPDTLADRIRTTREARDWNQSELARALKVSPQTVQQWEKGGGIRTPRLKALAKVLGVTPEWLSFGVQESFTAASHTAGFGGKVDLSDSVLAQAHSALSWRFQLVGLDYSIERWPGLFRMAIEWVCDPTTERMDALRAAIEQAISESGVGVDGTTSSAGGRTSPAARRASGG